MIKLVTILIFSFVLSACAQITAQPQSSSGRVPEAKDMSLVGYGDLQARSAYQPVIHRQGSRFIAYIGHHGGQALNPLTGKVEPNGTSIVDVTDPRNPKYLGHIPGSAAGSGEAGGAQMVPGCDGKKLPKALPANTPLLPTPGQAARDGVGFNAPTKPN